MPGPIAAQVVFAWWWIVIVIVDLFLILAFSPLFSPQAQRRPKPPWH
ncbi:MAG: hypothetical protein AB1776_01345 [Bacillota bacterium]